MLTLTRDQGQSIYLGTRLSLSDLDGTCDYRIDFDVVDHRVATRRIEVTIIGRHLIERFTLTPQNPDLDFAPNIRLAMLNTLEFMRDGKPAYSARIGIKAPRDVQIIRDDACPVMAVNVTGATL